MSPVGRKPRPARQPIFNAPPATLWTCAALIVIYLAFNLLGVREKNLVLFFLAFMPARFDAQIGAPGILPTLAALFTLVGHALMHANPMHLLLNCGFLLAFGSVVERRFGAARFLLFFALCAAAGALAEALFAGGRVFYLIGASGAVYGMMGAFVIMMARGGSAARSMALNFVMIVMALNLVLAMLGVTDFLAGAQVAWRAHIGGFVMGLVLALVLQPPRAPRSRR